jgi:DNA-directed RNA polymerase subunit RPC12/RpoP
LNISNDKENGKMVMDMVELENQRLPTCPHCGNMHENYFEYADDGIYNCAQCGKEFEVETEKTITFTTRPVRKSLKMP